MIDKTLSTMAMLKTMYDEKMYIVDCYVPLMEEILLNHNISEIDIDSCDEIEKAFLNDFGLNVPLSGIITILKRLASGVARKCKNVYTIDLKAISANPNTPRRYKKTLVREMMDGFKEFAHTNYHLEISSTDIDSAFVDFFKSYHSEMVLFIHDNGAFPVIKRTPQHKHILYVLGEYLRQSISKPEVMGLLTDISIGMAISESVFLLNYSDYCSGHKGLNVYLDVHFLFFFVGIGGEYLQRSYKKYIENIVEAGCKVFVFEQHLDEFNMALDDCCDWINNPNYDEQKASRTCQFFMKNNLNKSDVELFRAKLVDLRAAPYNVNIVKNKIDYSETEHLIDEQELRNQIACNYTGRFDRRDSYKTDNIIHRDVQAISAIYYLRRGKNARSLKQAAHIFVTNNTSLAFSAYQYHKTHEKTLGKIPGCISSHFFNNLLWLGDPTLMAEKSIQLQLIASISINSELHPLILTGFIRELKKLIDDGKVSLAAVEHFRNNMVMEQILKDLTHNDPNNFNGQTPIDAMCEYENQIKEPLQQEILTKKSEIDALTEENKSLLESIDSKDTEINAIKDQRNKLIEIIVIRTAYNSRRITQLAFIVLAVLFIALSIYNLLKVHIMAFIGVLIISVLSMLDGFLSIGFASILQNKLFHANLRKSCQKNELDYNDIIKQFNGTAKDYALTYKRRAGSTFTAKRRKRNSHL